MSSSLSTSPPTCASAPNLEELLGTALAQRLLHAAGGLVALSRLSDGALRHLGAESVGLTGRARLLHSGFLADAPVFVQCFGEDDVTATDLAAARKGLAQLGKKCVLAVKTDVSGGAPDGSFGGMEREKLKEAFQRLLAEGKVSVVDTQALPVPEVHKRGEAPKRRRGGIKEFKKNEARQEVPSVVEKTFARVRLGVSEDQQREEHLQSNELRVAFMKEQEKMIEQATRKRGREEAADDEYDDLLNLAL